MGFGSMSPWEANEHFAAPKYNEVALTGNNPQRVADANPQRVGIIFSIVGNAVGTTSVAPSSRLGANGGIALGTNTAPLFFIHQQWGALIQAEWFANGSAGQTLTVVENILNDYPQDDPDDTKDVRDYIDVLAERVKALTDKIAPEGYLNAVYSDPDSFFRRYRSAVPGVRGP